MLKLWKVTIDLTGKIHSRTNCYVVAEERAQVLAHISSAHASWHFLEISDTGIVVEVVDRRTS